MEKRIDFHVGLCYLKMPRGGKVYFAEDGGMGQRALGGVGQYECSQKGGRGGS